jgi:hypothetical protein
MIDADLIGPMQEGEIAFGKRIGQIGMEMED